MRCGGCQGRRIGPRSLTRKRGARTGGFREPGGVPGNGTGGVRSGRAGSRGVGARGVGIRLAYPVGMDKVIVMDGRCGRIVRMSGIADLDVRCLIDGDGLGIDGNDDVDRIGLFVNRVIRIDQAQGLS